MLFGVEIGIGVAVGCVWVGGVALLNLTGRYPAPQRKLTDVYHNHIYLLQVSLSHAYFFHGLSILRIFFSSEMGLSV